MGEGKGLVQIVMVSTVKCSIRIKSQEKTKNENQTNINH